MNDKLFLRDWLCYVTDLHSKSIDLGLDRVRDIAVELDLLHPASFVVIIGGTNGKGTTCRLLEVILLSSGMKVGVYTSPHLLSYTERIRVNGKELPESLHVGAMALIDKVRSFRSLTYFEFVTLSSLYLLKAQNLDVVILEVGLGGRLDATNIVNPDISVVTNVAIDHTDLLGFNYMDIAKEKFGIFRFNKPAIVGDFKCFRILRKIIFNWYGAIPFIKNNDWFFCFRTDGTWCWWDKNCILDYLPYPRNIPVENAAVVLAVISRFPFRISRKVIDYSLNVAKLDGRFQILSHRPLIILDVCHNPHAASYLSKRLKMIRVLGQFRLVVGMLSNKNIFDTLHAFDNLLPVWYFTSLNDGSGASASQLAYCIKDTVVREFENVYEAFNCAIFDSDVEDCIVVFGSFRTVAPIFQLLKKKF